MIQNAEFDMIIIVCYKFHMNKASQGISIESARELAMFSERFAVIAQCEKYIFTSMEEIQFMISLILKVPIPDVDAYDVSVLQDDPEGLGPHRDELIQSS